MSIPKIIHYCWFGENPKSELNIKCIDSWKKYCPDYEIIQWNEDNFDISACPLYVRQAYEAKKWAFVSDYARLKIIYEHGGIYLDTDVELLRPLDELLKYKGFFGFEDKDLVATGLGFGAVKSLKIINEMMCDYNDILFIYPDGSINYTACPKINTHVFVEHGLVLNNKKQLLDNDVLILPTEYLCPIDYHTDKLKKTSHTISIHWFSKSWMTAESIKNHEIRKKEIAKDFWFHLPNRILIKLLGNDCYEKLKCIRKGK